MVISAVSVLSGVLLSVVPTGKLKIAYKSLISVILVYTFLLGVIEFNSIDFNAEEYIKDNYKVSENLDRYAIDSMISSAEKAIEGLLDDYAEKSDIECMFKVVCAEEDGNIVVNEISVSDCTEADASKIYDLITALGFEKNIISISGESNEQ